MIFNRRYKQRRTIPHLPSGSIMRVTAQSIYDKIKAHSFDEPSGIGDKIVTIEDIKSIMKNYGVDIEDDE